MTISEYLKNPYGKGSAFSSSLKQKEELDKQFNDLMDKIVSKIYRYRDFVIYHVIIPSTKKDNVTYDVVVEIEIKNIHSGNISIENIPFKIFSNCPSFIFTYAHVFRGNEMLCDWLISKYNPEVRKKAPTQRNQYGIVGLERSVYLALKHLHFHKKTDYAVYTTSGKKISGRTEIINSVRTQQQIMDKVREKIPLEKEKPVTNNTSKVSNNNHSSSKSNTVKNITSTKTVKNVRTIKASNTTKNAKTTKKI